MAGAPVVPHAGNTAVTRWRPPATRRSPAGRGTLTAIRAPSAQHFPGRPASPSKLARTPAMV